MTARSAAPPTSRILALDLVRGVAVLGILAINIAGFAGPTGATLSPNVPVPATFADEAWFAFATLVFEGKMRALFSLLFGASMLLFIERADAARQHPDGISGEALQLRRLGWLALFGYLHFLLFWWGDILFTYALAGFVALAMRNAPLKPLAGAALMMFTAWHGLMIATTLPQATLEQHVLRGTASAPVAADYRSGQRENAAATARELAGYRQGFTAQIAGKLATRSTEPLDAALVTIGETLPLMLLGMVLFRSGFFAGKWRRRVLVRLAIGGIAGGGVLTLAFLGWAWPRHFPPGATGAAIGYWLGLPHLMMAAGYAAALVLWAPRLAPSRLGRRLVAAGRMAFSNYLGTTVVMTALFYGWGLGLIGSVPGRWQWLFVVGGWALMLGWSKPWLERFRQGPLEWAWRSLTYARITPLRRAD